jgi:lambda family phage minor tail protein L
VTAPQSDLISEANQGFAPGALVVLFELDTTPLGGVDILRFTSTAFASTVITWDGNDYTPVDVEANGFEFKSGQLPQPSIRIVNVNNVVSSVIFEFADLVGAGFRRIRTYQQFLDGQPGADPTAKFPDDVFVIERKVTQNKVFVEWSLSAKMDQEGKYLPGRQVLREICTHTYRRGSAIGEFDYTGVTCPYVADPSYDEQGNLTIVPNDRCGKRVFDCKRRFGENGILPGRFFPGAGGQR